MLIHDKKYYFLTLGSPALPIIADIVIWGIIERFDRKTDDHANINNQICRLQILCIK